MLFVIMGMYLFVYLEVVRGGDPSARLKGDLVIGALFSVHHTPRGGQGALVCGPVRETYGIQRVETALITLDKINNDSTILPGVTLGLEARDSCWSAPVALQQSIELVRDAITPALTQPQIPPNADTAHCLVTTAVQMENPVLKAPLVGVVGPGSSSVALQVQNLLQLFSIPQIGYSSTSRDLSDKTRYSTFLRVVPSDHYQAQLLVDLVRYFNWTYVSIVNTDENYGQSGIQAFRELAERSGVCVAREDAVLSTAEDAAFDGVLSNLDQDRAANVVVCFCEGMTMRGLLAASKRLNLTGRFMFIGSDGWADRDDVVEDLEFEAWGSLSIRIHSPYVSEFDDHYFSLNPYNNSRNPWFQELWQHKFNCVLPDVNNNNNNNFDDHADIGDVENGVEISTTTTTVLPVGKKICTGNEKLSDRYKQDPKMSFVMKSFWAMAHGLHNMLEEVCGKNFSGVCKEMHPFNGTLFKNHLMNITFSFGGEDVEFDRRGDPPGRYEILNFQRMANMTYSYVQIGDWNNGTLAFSGMPQSRVTQLVESVCSKPCPPGYYKNFKTGGQEKRCCWACVRCGDHEVADEEQLQCDACPYGQWPNNNKTECYVIPVEYMSWGDAEAIVAMGFSAIGLLATFATCRIFVSHNNTPVVKASTRELSYLILAGITMAHVAVFPILAKPTVLTCAVSRLMPGISFAMIYASLLTKTNRIARILAGSKKRFPTRKPLFMSATAQVVITCILIMIEAGVATAMLVIDPPMPQQEFPARHRSVLTCATSPRAVLSPLAFDAILLILCTLYAVKTRNVPENFNEAKFIGFAMYTTCVIWVAFVPIYFGSESKVITMSMCVTLSASVTLIFLFLPKLYIIVLRPERNNRALFTTSKSIRCHIGARVAAAIAEPPSKQTIYRLSGSANDMESGTAAGCRTTNNVHRRTLSVQTGAELLADLYKSSLENLCGMRSSNMGRGVAAGDIKKQKSPIHNNELLRSSLSSVYNKSTDEKINPHFGSSIASITADDIVRYNSEEDVFWSRETARNLKDDKKNPSSDSSLLNSSTGSQLKIPREWAELDPKKLIADTMNKRSSTGSRATTFPANDSSYVSPTNSNGEVNKKNSNNINGNPRGCNETILTPYTAGTISPSELSPSPRNYNKARENSHEFYSNVNNVISNNKLSKNEGDKGDDEIFDDYNDEGSVDARIFQEDEVLSGEDNEPVVKITITLGRDPKS
ncbi:metabotropic glutamate receptor 1-like [Athalia rosae]|uniref:metabotropic glutamate receptor 1-like n=1 Tax=Athalia rosae TaxID=37344 RepID=UPI0020347D29|nr:metabotropic glutamate receptor 1-like [Athalia rosae]XP_048507155.1 metabotropic glutamate receptor 1-like [Athalia rosae]XP_048507156.1 metabotropic glutamate receptor 1-like [Athalia rosae]XP_048507157.1 metabotropic glutamate receptor 1-like [Athalia rosae]XP_048507158.1 metabotropic glutamate receptor 1-like [Athalia rosae]XP_048507159.1 metabotropic glutamate receptor 1-like [Athalia rosae]XP_048507160.1 metabotropic glutamate receptor 1-like [Athalia rosae]XP_048507161.1 metabotrop